MFRHQTILGLLDLSQLRGVKPTCSKHGPLVTEVIALPRVNASVSASGDGICETQAFFQLRIPIFLQTTNWEIKNRAVASRSTGYQCIDARIDAYDLQPATR